MAQISQQKMQQQFKVINYIGLAIIGSVFIYAAVVTAISMGYISYQGGQPNNPIFTKGKYILLLITFLIYFVIKRVKKITSKSVKAYLLGNLIVFALCDAVGIYGLVCFLLTGNSTYFYIFMIISLGYSYIFYPKYSEYETLCSQE